MAKYRDKRRRKMDKFRLEEISFVDRPAQQPALAAIIKNHGEDAAVKAASVDQLLDDEFWEDAVKGGGDLVDLQSSVNEGHAHGVNLYYDEDGLSVIVSYAFSGEENSYIHDHQITIDEDGNYVMTENHGHTHTIDQERMNQAIISLMSKSVDKQEISQEIRERLAESGEALPDGSFPIRNREDLRNAISAFGRARESERGRVARHIQRRARALGATDMIPDQGVLADILKSLEKKMDELEKANEEIQRLNRIIQLNDAEKSYFNDLNDSKDQAEFLEKSASQRAAIIEDLEKSNPVVYTDSLNQEYRKSDDPRLVEMAKQRDEDRRELAKMRLKSEDDEVTKRAESYPFLKGDLDTRKALIKAVDAIEDEEVRKGVFDILQSANKTNEPLFKSIGVQGQKEINGDTDRQDAEGELDKRAKELMKSENIDYYTAYDKIKNSDPELFKRAIG